jgi:hypothetical protein
MNKNIWKLEKGFIGQVSDKYSINRTYTVNLFLFIEYYFSWFNRTTKFSAQRKA